MAEYYYILASLPYLEFSEKPPLSHKHFWDLCIPWMGPGDRNQLQSARLEIENIQPEIAKNDVLKKWIVFENTLRTELVRLRAQNLEVSAGPFIRMHIEYDPSFAPHIREALKGPSPHAIETAILELRWNFLTDNEVGHYFDLTALIIYSLKLQMLERIASFDKEKGRQVLQSIIEGNKLRGFAPIGIPLKKL